MRIIRLTQGCIVFVDDEDYDRLVKYSWRVMKPAKNRNQEKAWYAIRTSPRPERKVIYMHREILDAPDGVEVDHKNGNGLDNQKENLRLATRSEQVRNRRGTVGATYDNRPQALNRRWIARIRDEKGKMVFLGRFLTKEEAVQVYNDACVHIASHKSVRLVK